MCLSKFIIQFFRLWGANICFLPFVMIALQGFATNTIHITAEPNWKKTLVSELEILRDEGGHFNSSQILNDTSIRFYPNKGEKPSGLQYWARFTLVNNSDRDEHIIFESLFWDHVDIFIKNAHSRVDTSFIGILTTQYRPNFLLHKADSILVAAKFESEGLFRREDNINLSVSKSLSTLSRTIFFNYLDGIMVGIMLGLAVYNLFLYISLRDKAYLWYTIYAFSCFFLVFSIFAISPSKMTLYFMPNYPIVAFYIKKISDPLAWIALLQFSRLYLKLRVQWPLMNKIFNVYTGIMVLLFIINWAGLYQFNGLWRIIPWNIAVYLGFFTALYMYLKGYLNGHFFILGQFSIAVGFTMATLYYSKINYLSFLPHTQISDYVKNINFVFFTNAAELILFSFALANKYNVLQKDVVRIRLEKEQEKQAMLAAQNETLEIQVKERTQELTQSLDKLKATQAQLIQSEKMASLGELTSGIAHEIQNPLNFINNFSELNLETLVDIESTPSKNGQNNGELCEVDLQTITILKKNSERIHHHGGRIDSIVKSMLQHSRKGNASRESVDINAICEESLKLAYHAYRAKDKSFSVEYETNFDQSSPHIMVIPQDINRVVLNVINNAFYACVDRSRIANMEEENTKTATEYAPMVKITTKANAHEVSIYISDNGGGIPTAIIDKIFQPFFTTKPTGEGTGLGLSLAYDIITKGHNGELKVKSRQGVGTEFEIILPKNV